MNTSIEYADFEGEMKEMSNLVRDGFKDQFSQALPPQRKPLREEVKLPVSLWNCKNR